LKNEKISLCCITSNCEGIIAAFLERFGHIADEICIVRAIGKQEPDKTISIAGTEGCKVGEYFNDQGLRSIETIDPTTGADRTIEVDKGLWPHVDSFAAARNQAGRWHRTSGSCGRTSTTRSTTHQLKNCGA
jgi:hypothetical protein